MKKLHLNKKTYIVFLIVVVIILLVLIINVFKYTYAPVSLEKKRFSEKETKVIYEVLNIHPNQANIDKLTFSHAKDSLFIIYISNLDLSSLKLNYTKYDSYDSETYYRKNDDFNINCILNESNQKYTAVFRIEHYNEYLYNMVKDN